MNILKEKTWLVLCLNSYILIAICVTEQTYVLDLSTLQQNGLHAFCLVFPIFWDGVEVEPSLGSGLKNIIIKVQK